MGTRNRFVRPDVVRLPLTDGDWIEVKRQLTVGERRGILSKAARGGVSTDGTRVHLDGAEMAFGRVEAWLVDWSFSGLDGKPMKLSGAAIRALESESFAEIEAALDVHEEEAPRLGNSPASTAGSSSTPTVVASNSEGTSRSVDSSGGATAI